MYRSTLKMVFVLISFAYLMVLKAAVASDLDIKKKQCEDLSWGGEYTKSIAMCKKVLRDEPGHVQSIYYLARSYRNIEEYDTAIKWYDKGLSIDPENVKLIASKGQLYNKIGKSKFAYDSARKAIEIDPEAPEGYELMGTIFYKKENYLKAIEYYKSAQGFAENDWREENFRNTISLCYRNLSNKTDNSDQKLKYLMAALEIHPEGWVEYAFLSEYYENKEDIEKTYEYAVKVIERNPPEKWENVFKEKIALYYIDSGKKENNENKKIKYFKDALEIAPDYFYPYAVLSDYYNLRKNEEESFKYALETLKFDLNRHNKLIMSQRIANYYYNRDDFPNAYKYYRDVCFTSAYNQKNDKFNLLSSNNSDLRTFYISAYKKLIELKDFISPFYVEALMISRAYTSDKGQDRRVNRALRVKINGIGASIDGDIPYLGMGYEPKEVIKLYVKDDLSTEQPLYFIPGRNYKYVSFEESFIAEKKAESHKQIDGMVVSVNKDHDYINVLFKNEEYQINGVGQGVGFKIGDQVKAELFIEKQQYETKVYDCVLIDLVEKSKPGTVLTGRLKKKLKRRDYSDISLNYFVVDSSGEEFHVYDISGSEFDLFEENDPIKIRVFEKYSSIKKYNPVRYSLYEIDPKFKAELVKQKEQEYAKYVSQLKSGKRKVKTIEEAVIKFDASDDSEYTRQPPIKGPAKRNQFFVWRGKLVRNEESFFGSDIFIVWESTVNPFYEAFQMLGADLILTRGFAFKNIEETFGEIKMNSTVTVVGRYCDNMEVQLVNGEKKLIPVLEDCYIW